MQDRAGWKTACAANTQRERAVEGTTVCSGIRESLRGDAIQDTGYRII